MNTTWQGKIIEYCKNFNIPLYYLADALSDLKVVPMIRGKSFEYSVLEILQKVLSHDNEWKVDKPFMNAQTGLHDIDVRITHLPTGKTFGVECKLSAKGSFRVTDSGPYIRVKCMRSRTLGATRVEALAPILGVPGKQLLVHNDQYLPTNFDYVITSLANAFYVTDKETGEYVWKPTQEAKNFLMRLGGQPESLKDFAFNKLYIARSTSLFVGGPSGVVCARRGCTDQNGCGFIPNYPVIKFDKHTLKPTNGWFELDDCLSLISSELTRAEV